MAVRLLPRHAASLRLERARTVASSLDLRGARVEEALEALDRYLDDAGVAGLGSVDHHPWARDGRACAMRFGPPPRRIRWCARSAPASAGEGGDGATVVTL